MSPTSWVLRAFTSQLLCEQVVGRGLRRVSYDTDEKGLFLPEYVNLFWRSAVHLGNRRRWRFPSASEADHPRLRSSRIAHLEIKWPNVLRVETVVKPQLTMAWDKIPALVLDPASTPISAELAPALGGATDMGNVTAIESGAPSRRFRLQRLVFHRLPQGFCRNCARAFLNRGIPRRTIVRIVESFLNSKLLDIPSLFTPILCVAGS